MGIIYDPCVERGLTRGVSTLSLKKKMRENDEDADLGTVVAVARNSRVALRGQCGGHTRRRTTAHIFTFFLA